MSELTRVIRRTVSLDGLARPESLPGLAYQGEQNAHRFIVRGVSNGEAVALAGDVLLRFLRSDGVTVDVPGAIEDGAAVVTLSGNCYQVMGRAELTLFVADDNASVAIYAANATVIHTSGAAEVPGGDTIGKGYVTPEMFGARGDCVTDAYGMFVSGTDDTQALRAALEYPNVRLAAKKYYFTGTLSVDGCALSGSGIDQTYLVTDIPRQCAISIDGTVGGIEGLTLECCGVEINGIEMDGGLAVKPGQFVRSVRVNRAEGIGLYYKNGWQSEIHDIYTGNCLVGIRFDGADVTAHDLNISGNPSRNDLKQGLYINAGTVKINNVKIDQYGCALDAPYYPLYVLGQRNQLSNIEVQECGTFGALIGGSYQHVSGLLIDKIGGRTVSVAGGHALRIGMDLDHSVIDAVIRNTIGTTDIVSVGNFAHGSSFAPDYYATPAYCRDNVIHVVSETECIFSDIPPGDIVVMDYSLEEWKALGVVQNLAADGSTSDFRLAIKPATFPNIDFTEIKCLAFELRYLSAQALNTFSFYGDNGSIVTRRGQLIFNAANLRYTAETSISSTGFTLQVTATSGNTFKPTWIRLYLYKRDGRKHYRYYV